MVVLLVLFLQISPSFSQDADPALPEDKPTSQAANVLKDAVPADQKSGLLAPAFTYGQMYTQCGEILKPAEAPPAKVSANAAYDKFQHLGKIEKCVSERFNELMSTHYEQLCAGKNKLECAFYFFYGKVRTSKGIANVISTLRLSLLSLNGVPAKVTKADVDYRTLDYMDSLAPEKLFFVQTVSQSEDDKKRFAAHVKAEIAELKYVVFTNLNIIDGDIRALAPKTSAIRQRLIERSTALRKRNWDL